MDTDMDWDGGSDKAETTEREIKQRNHAGPLPKVLYELFIKAVRSKKCDKQQYPSGPELKALGFPKPKGGHTRRERFKHWASRMEVVYCPDVEREMLVHRRTGKIIVPLEEFEDTIRKAHENGKEKHNELKATIENIQKKFTIGSRDFGMTKGVIRYVVDSCQECIMDFAIADGTANSPLALCNGLLPRPESCSMVAHIPNGACIWFDKSVLLPSAAFHPKLMSLLNEVRGELPGIARGNREAKGRFCIKIFAALNCIQSQMVLTKNASEVSEPFSHQIHEDLKELFSVYQQENLEHQFESDMWLLEDFYKHAGFSDYFLRSLQASISLISQGQPEVAKQQVLPHSNGLTLGLRSEPNTCHL